MPQVAPYTDAIADRAYLFTGPDAVTERAICDKRFSFAARPAAAT